MRNLNKQLHVRFGESDNTLDKKSENSLRRTLEACGILSLFAKFKTDGTNKENDQQPFKLKIPHFHEDLARFQNIDKFRNSQRRNQMTLRDTKEFPWKQHKDNGAEKTTHFGPFYTSHGFHKETEANAGYQTKLTHRKSQRKTVHVKQSTQTKNTFRKRHRCEEKCVCKVLDSLAGKEDSKRQKECQKFFHDVKDSKIQKEFQHFFTDVKDSKRQKECQHFLIGIKEPKRQKEGQHFITDVKDSKIQKESQDFLTENQRIEKKQSAPKSQTISSDVKTLDDLEAGDLDDMNTSWQNFKKKAKNLTSDFAGETTAHGYKRTISSSRSKTGKLFWAVAILGVTIVVMNTLLTLTSDEEMYAFSSRIKSQPYIRMSFPAVTVCNLIPYDFCRLPKGIMNNQSYLVQQFLKEINTFAQSLMSIPNDTKTVEMMKKFTTKDLDDNIGWKINTFVKKCFWNEKPVGCSGIFTRTLSGPDTCFTFNADLDNQMSIDRVGSLSGLGLVINLGPRCQEVSPEGIKLIVHDPKEIPNIMEKAMLLTPGPDITAHLSVSKKEAYGTEFCAREDDALQIKGSNYNDIRKSFYNFTGYTSCMTSCRLKKIISKCGCLAYAGDPEVPGIPYCTMDKYIWCYLPTLRETYMQSPFNTSNCACPLPCKHVKYSTRISTANYPKTSSDANSIGFIMESDIKEHLLELKVYYEELYTHIEEHVPMNTWSTIFGNIGGQMGLFTGASVLTVLEFMELGVVLLLLLCEVAYNYFTRNNRNSQ